jgi:phosphoglycolate phosphatase
MASGRPLVVGFDLDMTLIDSRPGIRASLAALSAETGVQIDADVVVGRLGPKLEWELAHWFDADAVPHAAERYRAHYWEQCTGAGTIALPGAHEGIAAVRELGGRVLLVTAKAEKHAARCVESVGLDVDVIVGHVHGDEKRDALRSHGAAFYVGDTVTDVRSALAADAIAIAVTTGPDDEAALRAAGAHDVIDSLHEFGSVAAFHLSGSRASKD